MVIFTHLMALEELWLMLLLQVLALEDMLILMMMKPSLSAQNLVCFWFFLFF